MGKLTPHQHAEHIAAKITAVISRSIPRCGMLVYLPGLEDKIAAAIIEAEQEAKRG